MTHELTITLTERDVHTGGHKAEFTTTRAGTLSDLVDAFNALLKIAGYCNEVEVKEAEA